VLTVVPDVFSGAMCAFMSYGLQADARRARHKVPEKGYIRSGRAGSAEDAPGRRQPAHRHWLPILQMDLDPDLARTFLHGAQHN
jgi:hypothetical protein